VSRNSAVNQDRFEWTPDFWQGWRESKNPYRQYKSQRDRLLVLEALDLHDGERILEAGFGYGWISQCLWGAAKIEWFGVDRSPAMVSRLLQISPDAHERGLVADAIRIPFRDGEFDKVLCTGVLMHISDTDAAVRELVRVLRPGGRLVCSINNSCSPFSLPVRVWNRRKTGFVQKFRMPRSFRRFLCQTGIEVTEIRGDGIFATVPFTIGRVQLPPQSIFPLIRKLDEWAVWRFPWLAYEVWFSGVKAAPRCTF
jgi:SAM-dependent methyltransferase